MKRAWFGLMMVLAAAGPAVWAAEQTGPAAPVIVAPATSPATEMLIGCINDMQMATAPGEIRAAHQRCEVLRPVSLRLDVTFVERMVARGEPEGALEAAKRVLEKNPNNGLARAVVAYNEARAEEWASALQDLIQANVDRPHDPLIALTAGWVLAWLDNAADTSTMPAELGPKIDFLRRTVSESATFKNVYLSAALDYQGAAAATYKATYGGTFASDPRPPLVQVPFRIPVGPVIWQSVPERTNYWFTFPNGVDMRKSGSLWWFPGEAVANDNGVIRNAPGFNYQWPTTSAFRTPPSVVGIGQ